MFLGNSAREYLPWGVDVACAFKVLLENEGSYLPESAEGSRLNYVATDDLNRLCSGSILHEVGKAQPARHRSHTYGDPGY